MRIGFFSVADGYLGEIDRDTGQLYRELLERQTLAPCPMNRSANLCS